MSQSLLWPAPLSGHQWIKDPLPVNLVISRKWGDGCTGRPHVPRIVMWSGGASSRGESTLSIFEGMDQIILFFNAAIFLSFFGHPSLRVCWSDISMIKSAADTVYGDCSKWQLESKAMYWLFLGSPHSRYRRCFFSIPADFSSIQRGLMQSNLEQVPTGIYSTRFLIPICSDTGLRQSLMIASESGPA